MVCRIPEYTAVKVHSVLDIRVIESEPIQAAVISNLQVRRMAE